MAHEFRLRVYYEDTDAGGVVYYANYLKFAERARTEALLGLGISQSELHERLGLLFVVKGIAVDYRAPARLEDRLVVRTRLTGLGAARILMEQQILREAELLARCDVALACIGPEGRPARMPASLRETIASLKAAEPRD
ncbi:tol-pal system-associated acyl-CoA thioesterase [Rhodobacteraceae bacterium DSL-40]|uniref:tol-pal system-associated acyl-CoA thioesterase n=1 Tax=Amaricoccus sp. B4 TaxID=3368557 RepID=UPI000DAEBEC3